MTTNNPTSDELRRGLIEAIERQKRVQENAQKAARARRAALGDEPVESIE
tara:strand:- start:4257 stop:4406 length:150 start_codon:yes stop_codon:yes gene_type:complete